MTSFLPAMRSSDSRTNGNGGTSRTILLTVRLTASLHSYARARLGSLVALASALSVELASLVSLCFTSMMSNVQPSLSMPMKKS
jgi:hypothetical protein